MIAVIQTGGKQYLVKPGQFLRVEKLEVEAGQTVTFDKVLMVADKETTIGTPYLAAAKVTAAVVTNGKAKKVTGVKFHNKVRYRRTIGHRQPFTQVKIDKITA